MKNWLCHGFEKTSGSPPSARLRRHARLRVERDRPRALGSARDRYKGYNTPSLRGVYRKVKLLHDGRADSLRDVLTGPHAPENVAGNGKLGDNELNDLLEYLKTPAALQAFRASGFGAAP